MNTSNSSSRPRSLARNLGRVFLFLSILLALVILLLAAGSLGTKKKTKINVSQIKAAVVSGHPEWAPIMYRDGDSLTGVGPELVKKIFADLGLPEQTKYMGNWEEVLAKAKTGEVDILVGAYRTKERLDYLVFSSTPYAEDPVALFVSKDKNFTYQDHNSLLKKKGVAMTGDSYGQIFDDFIIAKKLDITRVKTAQEAFDLVTQGKADYFVYSLYAGEKALAADPILKQKISIVPKYVATEDFYLAISKKSPYLKYLPDITKDLYEQKKSAYVNYLLNKYKVLLEKPASSK